MNLQFFAHLKIILIYALVLDIAVGKSDLFIPSLTDVGFPFDKLIIILAFPFGFILHMRPDSFTFSKGISSLLNGPIMKHSSSQSNKASVTSFPCSMADGALILDEKTL